jgi:hypothetical protein
LASPKSPPSLSERVCSKAPKDSRSQSFSWSSSYSVCEAKKLTEDDDEATMTIAGRRGNYPIAHRPYEPRGTGQMVKLVKFFDVRWGQVRYCAVQMSKWEVISHFSHLTRPQHAMPVPNTRCQTCGHADMPDIRDRSDIVPVQMGLIGDRSTGQRSIIPSLFFVPLFRAPLGTGQSGHGPCDLTI